MKILVFILIPIGMLIGMLSVSNLSISYFLSKIFSESLSRPKFLISTFKTFTWSCKL